MRLLLDLTARHAAFGLAVDEALLESARRGGEDAARMWVSERAVVIGRSQAMASECDVAVLEEMGVPALRRVSGGGAVYHYPGNLNVSMVFANARRLGTAEVGFERLGRALARGLRELDIVAEVRDRMLVLRGEKVSGAAQARRGDAILVHATLLVLPDTLKMESLLRALRPGYSPMGAPSRPHATTTLSGAMGRSLDLESAAGAVGHGLSAEFNVMWTEATLSEAEASHARKLEAEKYRSREWNEPHEKKPN